MTKKRRRLSVLLLVFGILVALAAATLLLREVYTRYQRAAYPVAYEAEVRAAAEECGLPPSLILGVIRTESHFRAGAVSSAGAVGLMQITEPTLEWALMRKGEGGSLTAEDLTDPKVNLRIGCYVLLLLGELFENEDTVLAAYNAGLGRVRGWLQDERYSADGVTLHTIPIAETAQYVEKVRTAQKMYQKLYCFE